MLILRKFLVRKHERALLFKELATLRVDAPLIGAVDELRWRGPTDAFDSWTERLGSPRLLERTSKAATGARGAPD